MGYKENVSLEPCSPPQTREHGRDQLPRMEAWQGVGPGDLTAEGQSSEPQAAGDPGGVSRVGVGTAHVYLYSRKLQGLDMKWGPEVSLRP